MNRGGCARTVMHMANNKKKEPPWQLRSTRTPSRTRQICRFLSGRDRTLECEVKALNKNDFYFVRLMKRTGFFFCKQKQISVFNGQQPFKNTNK